MDYRLLTPALLFFAANATANDASSQLRLPACRGEETGWHKCFGKTTASDGTKFVGEFLNGRMTGKGTAVYATGEVYTGEFKDYFRDGYGTLIWTDGGKFVGLSAVLSG